MNFNGIKCLKSNKPAVFTLQSYIECIISRADYIFSSAPLNEGRYKIFVTHNSCPAPPWFVFQFLASRGKIIDPFSVPAHKFPISSLSELPDERINVKHPVALTLPGKFQEGTPTPFRRMGHNTCPDHVHFNVEQATGEMRAVLHKCRSVSTLPEWTGSFLPPVEVPGHSAGNMCHEPAQLRNFGSTNKKMHMIACQNVREYRNIPFASRTPHKIHVLPAVYGLSKKEIFVVASMCHMICAAHLEISALCHFLILYLKD